VTPAAPMTELPFPLPSKGFLRGEEVPVKTAPVFGAP
jgi:hypothetical protein